MASVSASSSGDPSAIESAFDDSIDAAFIDNGAYQYVISLTWEQDDLVPLLRFYGCRIEYTVSTLNP